MKVIFISGKYRDKRGEYYVRQNIASAEKAALFVWAWGGVAICPHKNTGGMSGALPEDVWLKGYIELIKKCDAVMAINDWYDSEGAKAEIDFAIQNNIPVLYGLKDTKAFLK